MSAIMSCFARVVLFVAVGSAAQAETAWVVDSAEEWEDAQAEREGIEISEGAAELVGDQGRYRSELQVFEHKRKPRALTFAQSPAWDNWEPVPNVGPEGSQDAPIFLPIADGNYWFFAEKPELGKGYHAWRSSDMKTWEHMGQANDKRWATTAEYADGKIYLYYDNPNDQDPHLVIGENLEGTPVWRQVGKVFDDPSHGSDAGVIRTEDGTFHLIYEDWTPINARAHSWDSPLAGHVDSPDGIHGFEHNENPPVIDHRTEPTGEYGTYMHSFTSDEPLKYEIHEPAQNAYGDYTLIKVGPRFYLFCDYHPHDGEIRIGYFSSDSLYKEFELTGSLGEGHPDPTIGFAEGKFYLIIQRDDNDYVSPGPWVDKVEARAGADQDGDGEVDDWTTWQAVREAYARKPGFARIVETKPAALDLTELPAGYGFCFEFRLADATANSSRPIIDRVTLQFEE